MTRLQNIVCFILMFRGLVISIKIWSHQHQEALGTWITMFSNEVIMTKTFIPIKSSGPWLPIWFHIFFNKTFLVLGCSFLCLGFLGLDYICILVTGSSYIGVYRFYQLCRYTKCFFPYLSSNLCTAYFAWQHYYV